MQNNIKEFISREDEMFDEQFPKLIVSINKSPWDRNERVEASGEIMRAFNHASILRFCEYLEGRLPKERDEEYGMDVEAFKGTIAARAHNRAYNTALSDFKNLLQEVKEGLTK